MEAVKAFHRMFADEDYMCIWHKNLSLQQIFQSIHVAELHIVLMLVNTLEDEPNFISSKSTGIRYYEQIHVTLNYSSCNVNTSISIYFIPMVLMERL